MPIVAQSIEGNDKVTKSDPPHTHDDFITLGATKKKKFSEKLWFCGHSVGEIEGVITFINLPVLYQMKVGVLSKKGIHFSSRPILMESQINTDKIMKDSVN
jgi:hypothetical protein